VRIVRWLVRGLLAVVVIALALDPPKNPTDDTTWYFHIAPHS
jgi:hypothetical protein